MSNRNYPDTKPLPNPFFEPIDIVFAGEGPHLTFVEVETTFGHAGIKAGEWWEDESGYKRLTLRPGEATGQKLLELSDRRIPFSLHFDPQTDPYAGDWTLAIGPDFFGGSTPGEAIENATEPLDPANNPI